MDPILAVQILFIVAALGCTFLCLVWPGIENMPSWAFWPTAIITAMGAGAVIHLLLTN